MGIQGLESEDSEGGGNDDSLDLVLGRGDTLEELESLETSADNQYCTLKRISHEVGWGYKDVVDRLEEKRKVKGQAYHERKVCKSVASRCSTGYQHLSFHYGRHNIAHLSSGLESEDSERQARGEA
jgi:hypothetical protein